MTPRPRAPRPDLWPAPEGRTSGPRPPSSPRALTSPRRRRWAAAALRLAVVEAGAGCGRKGPTPQSRTAPGPSAQHPPQRRRRLSFQDGSTRGGPRPRFRFRYAVRHSDHSRQLGGRRPCLSVTPAPLGFVSGFRGGRRARAHWWTAPWGWAARIFPPGSSQASPGADAVPQKTRGQRVAAGPHHALPSTQAQLEGNPRPGVQTNSRVPRPLSHPASQPGLARPSPSRGAREGHGPARPPAPTAGTAVLIKTAPVSPARASHPAREWALYAHGHWAQAGLPLPRPLPGPGAQLGGAGAAGGGLGWKKEQVGRGRGLKTHAHAQSW